MDGWMQLGQRASEVRRGELAWALTAGEARLGDGTGTLMLRRQK